MRKLIQALLSSLALLAGVAPALADNWTIKDSAAAVQTMCAKQATVSGTTVLLPCGSGPNQVPADAISPVIKDAFSVDGKLYAVPANFATLLLYYNKDLLRATDIDAPPKTMAELQADAVKLSNGKGQYGIALADNATIQMWPVLIWADGGDLIANKCSALDDPKTLGAVET